MSSLRRILVAGLPAAGLTVAASLALAGSPATAAADHAARPSVTATPCASADRDKCDYGNAGTGTTPAGGGAEAPATGGVSGHTRGHAGYATTTPPATTPATTKPTPTTPGTTTPTGNVDTVPPTASPSVTIQGGVTPTPSGGVSAGHALPVTGAPMSAVVSLGTLMIAGGAASVWYTRRRRSA